LYHIEIEFPMNRLIYFFILSLFTLMIQSCKDDEPIPVPGKSTATITFDARWNGVPFQMQQVYMDDFGNRIRADKFMNYFSFIKLVAEDGSEVVLKDFVLVDFSETNSYTADTTGTEGVELLSPIAIHAGDDFSYRNYTSPNFNVTIDGKDHVFAVHLNVDRIFSPELGNDVNIAQDAITHGGTNPDLTNNFMDNYLAALSLEP
jgi:hypothetical protein